MAILKSALPYVDIFMPSIEEILYMVRRQTYDDLASKARGSDFLALVTPELLSDVSGQLLDMGGKIVGLKMGDRGLYVRTADEATLEKMGRARPPDVTAWAEKEMWSSCFQVEFVGAAGSGDATIAGFLSALLRDMSPSEAVTAGVAVGACNVEAADTLSGVRSWEETMGRVAGGWARRDLGLASPGWEFDEAQQLWLRVGG
jgi:sugar/nucleoside kinase (ribokinase family)